MFKTFPRFSEYTFKIKQSLYTPVNYSETFTSKRYSTKFLLKEGVSFRQLWQIEMGIEMYNKQVCQNPQQMEKKKLRNYYFLLNNPTLNTKFKWQTLKVALILIGK